MNLQIFRKYCFQIPAASTHVVLFKLSLLQFTQAYSFDLKYENIKNQKEEIKIRWKITIPNILQMPNHKAKQSDLCNLWVK